MRIKLSIKDIIRGDFPEENRAVNFVEDFNGCILNLTKDSICIENENTIILKSNLEFIKEDSFSKTYKGWFGGDSYFRVVLPSEEVLRIIRLQKKEEWIIIASMKGKGYTVKFNLEEVI